MIDWKTVPESSTTSEQPSGHLRFVGRPEIRGGYLVMSVLQQKWYITSYRGTDVEQAEEWRDVPFVCEP